MEWRLLIYASFIVTITFLNVGQCNGNVILANISQSEGDWETAMQFCDSPLGSRNYDNTSAADINVSVTSENINRLAWIGAYGLYTSWLKMLGCVRVTESTLLGLTARQTTMEEVGVFNCFQFCKGLTYFALSVTDCFCFTNTFPSVSSGRCYPQRCSGNQEDFCGENMTTSNLVSIVNYQIDTTEFGGVEDCLASMYTGIFTEGGTSYYGFRAPVVLPCKTEGLGYTYRTRLSFPASHSFRLYTLPVTSWQDSVENSYGNQFGLLEFVIFRFRLPDLSQPLDGDRYWVGFLRRHKLVFGSEIPPGEQVHCVAGKIDSQGRITLIYRQCNESLPVLCEAPTSDVTSLSPSSDPTSAETTTVTATATTTPTGYIIDDSGTSSFILDWFVILAIFVTTLVFLIILGVCWICISIRKKQTAILNASANTSRDSDGLYTEIESVYSLATDRDSVSTVGDHRPLHADSVSLPERKKKRSAKRKKMQDKKRSLPRTPSEDLKHSSVGASRLSDLPVRRDSDFNVIRSVIEMYDGETGNDLPPKTSQNVPDVVPDGEYYVLEERKSENNAKESKEDTKDSNHFYHVLEPGQRVSELSRHDPATLRVSNRIPLSKWVGGRAASHEPHRVSRIYNSQEGNLETVQEEYEVDLNKTRKAASLKARPRSRMSNSSLHPHSALKSTSSAPLSRSRSLSSSMKHKATKQERPIYDSNGYVVPVEPKHNESGARESLYDHTRYRKSSVKSNQAYYDTLESIRGYVLKDESGDTSQTE